MGNAQDAELFKPSKDKTWKAYCAIDVGAVSCGYAYSFDGVKHIWMNKNWAESLGSYVYSFLPLPRRLFFRLGLLVGLFVNKITQKLMDGF